MKHKDFIKCINSENRIKILNILFQKEEEYSAYDMLSQIDLVYKNIYQILNQFKEIGVIEEIPERKPPHYAIKYKITKEGIHVLSTLETIENI